MVGNIRGFVALLGKNARASLGALARPKDRRRTFLEHIHPLKVSQQVLHPAATLGLGLITLFLFLLLALSGALLMLYYSPAAEAAYGSMLDIEHMVTFGAFVRRVHVIAAHAMVVFAAAHMLRVCATSAYRGAGLSFGIGLVLFGLVLAFALTGYLLPWDQRSYWAVQVVSHMVEQLPVLGALLTDLLLGGPQVGPAALVRCYTMHVAVLPALVFLFGMWHLWRLRRDSEKNPREGGEPQLPANPHLLLREATLFMLVLTAVSAGALLVDAPLGAPADVLAPENPEKAPWYFVGLQEIVSYSTVMGWLFPLAFGLLLCAFPLLDREEGEQRWLGSRAERLQIGGAALFGAAAFVASEWLHLRGIDWGEQPAWAQDLANPASLSMVAAGLAFFWIGAKSKAPGPALRGALVIFCIALVGLTFVGACRGPDWVFFWPWKGWPNAS